VKTKIKAQDIVIMLGLVFWPLSLFLANSYSNFITYLIPAAFLITSLILSRKQSKLYFLPILFIPFFEPKLALIPLGIAMLELFQSKIKKVPMIFLFLSLFVFLINWTKFSNQTIFTPDYEARQSVIRNTRLYETVFMARLFHNKARIPINKFNDNFFALSDPNNYFFGFHPRQIVVDNQNLNKFPFAALPFVLFGIYHLKKSKDKRFIINTFIVCLFSLSLLKIFDRNDFILWLPISLTFIHGVKQFSKKYKASIIFFLLFILFSIPELIRIFVR
jgi:hypothetical protein